MISKKKAIIVTIILVVLTGGLTFLGTMAGSLTLGNKVVISKYQYNEYKKLEKVLKLKDIVRKQFYQEVEDQVLIESMNKGTFEGLQDPYSQYYSKAEFKNLMESTSGSYVGVGVVISPGEDGLITVVAPIDDTPAEKAGIKPGDKILQVNGEQFMAKEMDKAISIIKGTPGEEVVLTVSRNNKTFDVPIIREEIQLKSVKSEMKEGIGYIRISSFDEKTGQEFNEHLNKIKAQSPKGLIIDLRDNPGGLLDQVKMVADSILGKGTIVYTKDRSGTERYLKSDAKGKLEIPLVLLVNGYSASASEILAGAVRDNGAGTLVGTTTFGKGLVQSVVELEDGTGYKLTTAQYFTPNGEYINKKGITPEVVIEQPEDQETDVQLEKALDIIGQKN